MIAANRTLWIEGGVDAGAASLVAAAAAFAAVQLAVDPALALVVPALAFAGAFYGLRAVEPCNAFPMRRFAAGQFIAAEPAELVLTDADRLEREELLLDRPLADNQPGSRVVRLFEPAVMPTPGELKARIDRHIANVPNVRGDGVKTAPPDESRALFEALSELRRSLR